MTDRRLATLLLVLAPLAYLLFVAQYAVDVPQHDDYDDALRQMITAYAAPDAEARTAALFAQHNDHLTWWNRLLYTAQIEALGHLDFRLLILFANLAVVALALVYAHVLRDDAGRPWIPFAALLMLQPLAWESVFWAMASLSNFWVVLFPALAFVLLGRRTLGATAAAAVFGGLASFTQGNGLLAWPIGLWLLLRPRSELRIPSTVLWLAAAALVASVYLASYEPSANALRTRTYALEHPIRALSLFVPWLLQLLAGPLSLGNKGIGIAVGAASLLWTLLALVSGMHARRPALFAMAVFLLGSLALAAGAHHQSFAGTPFAPRYRFYSVQLFMLATIGLGEAWLVRGHHLSRRFAPSLAAAGLALCLSGYAAVWGEVRTQRTELVEGMAHWREKGWVEGLAVHAFFVRDAPVVLKQAIRLGLYRPDGPTPRH